jgi:hypothetical protein
LPTLLNTLLLKREARRLECIAGPVVLETNASLTHVGVLSTSQVRAFAAGLLPTWNDTRSYVEQRRRHSL